MSGDPTAPATLGSASSLAVHAGLTDASTSMARRIRRVLRCGAVVGDGRDSSALNATVNVHIQGHGRRASPDWRHEASSRGAPAPLPQNPRRLGLALTRLRCSKSRFASRGRTNLVHASLEMRCGRCTGRFPALTVWDTKNWFCVIFASPPRHVPGTISPIYSHRDTIRRRLDSSNGMKAALL